MVMDERWNHHQRLRCARQFLHGFGDDFRFQSCFGIHLFQAPVLFFELFEHCHHRHIHPARAIA